MTELATLYALMALGMLVLFVVSILTPPDRVAPIPTIGIDRPALPVAVAIPTAHRRKHPSRWAR